MTILARRAIAGAVAIFLFGLSEVAATHRSACACTPLWHCLARAAVPTGACNNPPSAAVPQTYIQCCPRTSSTPEVSVTAASASIKTEHFNYGPTRSPSNSQEVSNSNEWRDDDNNWAQCGRRGEPSGLAGVAAPHEWPWHAAILEETEDRYVCGATLISATWLLSAAHCVVDYLGGTTLAPLKARLGELDVRTDNESPFPTQERRIAQMLPHPGFDARTLRHDAALLRMAAPAVAAPNVGAVCLPSPPTDVDSSSAEIPDDEDQEAECYVTGWGRKDEASSHSQILKSVRVPLWRRRDCDLALKPLLGSGYHLPEAALCAGAEGQDACDGDGGGPLVCRRGARWAQVGIVSFGVGCGRPNSPGVYTSVTRLARWVATMTGAVLPGQATASTPRSYPADAIDERPSDATTARTTPRPNYPVQIISYSRDPNSGFRQLHVPDVEDRSRQSYYSVRYGSPRNAFEDDLETSAQPFEHGTTLGEVPTTRQPVVFLSTVFRQSPETSTPVPNELETVRIGTSPFNSLPSSPLPTSRSVLEKQRRTDERSRGRTSNSRAPNARRWELDQYQVSTSTYRPVSSTLTAKNESNTNATREEPLKWGYGVVINHPPSQKNGTVERTTSAPAEALNNTTTPIVVHLPTAVAARPGLASNLSSSYSIYRIYPSTATRISGSRKSTPPLVRPPSKVSDDRQYRRGGKVQDVGGEVRPTANIANEDNPTTSSSTFKSGIQVATTFRTNTDDGPAVTDATTAGLGPSESSTTENTAVEITTTGYVATPASTINLTKTTLRDRLADKSTSSSGSIWVTPRAPLLPTPVSSSTTSTHRPATSVVIARGGRRHGTSRSRISWQTESETAWSSSNAPTSGVRHAFHPGLRKLPADDEPDYDELQGAAPPVQHIVRSRPRSRPPPPAAVAPILGEEVAKTSRTRGRTRTWNQNTGNIQRSSRRNNRVEKAPEITNPSTTDPFTRSRSGPSSPETWLSLSTVTPGAFSVSGSSFSRSKDEDDVGGRLQSVRISKPASSTTPSAISEDDILTNRAKNDAVLRNLSDENIDEGDIYAYLNVGRSSASRRRTATTPSTSTSSTSSNRRPRTRNADRPFD